MLRTVLIAITLTLSPLALSQHESARQQRQPIDWQEMTEQGALPLGQRVEVWQKGDVPMQDEEILNGQADQLFQSSNRELMSYGVTRGAIWIRLTINNPNSDARSLLLESRYVMLDQVTLFQKNSLGQYQSLTLGDWTPHAAQSIVHRTPVFTLYLQPGLNQYYIKVSTEGFTTIALYLWQEDAFSQHRWMDAMVLGLLMGMLICLFFYNCFLTISFQSRTYLAYTLFLLSMIATQMGLQGFWPFFLPSNLAVWAQNKGFLMVSTLTYCTGLWVTINFLNMRDFMPRLFLWFRLLQIVALVLLPLTFIIGYNPMARLMSAFLAVGSISMVVASVLAIFRGYRPAYSYSMAWIAILAANIALYLTQQGLFESIMMVQWGNLPEAVLEGILMSFALGDRVNDIRAKADRTIRELNSQLQNHLTRVEATVAERTATIRTLLDSVASGFLMVNAEGCIEAGFSRSCSELLGQTIKPGQDLGEVLGFKASKLQLWRIGLQQVFSDQLPIPVCLAQLPQTIRVGRRYLQLEGAEVRDERGCLQYVLFTITDGSRLRKKTREAKRNRTLLAILQNLDAFRQFIIYSCEAIQRYPSLHNPLDRAFLLHTLKGNCLVFHLHEIAEAIHALEEKSQLDEQDITRLEKQFIDFLQRHENVLHTSWGKSPSQYQVTAVQLHQLMEISRSKRTDGLEEWIQEVSSRPVGPSLQPLVQDCQSVAKSLNKEIAFIVRENQVRIRSQAEELVILELIHLLRNAVIHGIEDDRIARGKPLKGTIQIDFIESSSMLQIVCQDDGEGLDRLLWEQRLASQSQSSLKSLKAMSLVELILAMQKFKPETQSSSMIAGRGVGLAGFLASVMSHGADVDITSEPGLGSRFTITLPRSAASSTRAVS